MKRIVILKGLLILCFAAFLCGCREVSYLEASGGADPVFSEVDPEQVGAEEPSDVIIVQVAGEVVSPGVYELKPGSRVYQVIEAGGGLTEDADERGINQAAPLSDGEKIYIPSFGETSEDPKLEGASDTDGRININQADAAGLMTLPGIGETKASDIISYRDAHGPFADISDLKQVPGIGDGIFKRILDLICV